MFRGTFNNAIKEYQDFDDPFFAEIFPYVQPRTITAVNGAESPWATFQAVKYIVENKIPGDIVECGVWSGGVMLMIALTLLRAKDTSRKLYLYDTFAGMPRPDEIDKHVGGFSCLAAWENHVKNGRAWGFGGTLQSVKDLVKASGYPEDKMVFVEGMVEDTIPATMPSQISLLRLDTDFYRSTYHELTHLYPILSPGGILIIDDYGGFQGARAATDQYIAEQKLKLFLSRVDDSVRLAVKPGLEAVAKRERKPKAPKLAAAAE